MAERADELARRIRLCLGGSHAWRGGVEDAKRVVAEANTALDALLAELEAAREALQQIADVRLDERRWPRLFAILTGTDRADSLALALEAERHVHRQDNVYLLDRARTAEARVRQLEEALTEIKRLCDRQRTGKLIPGFVSEIFKFARAALAAKENTTEGGQRV